MPPYIEHLTQSTSAMDSPTSVRHVHHVIDNSSTSETSSRTCSNAAPRIALTQPIPFPQPSLMNCSSFPASVVQVYDPVTCSYIGLCQKNSIVVSHDGRHAYLLENVLQKAIYGHVRRARAVIIRNDQSFELVLSSDVDVNGNLMYEEFAIKCLDWELVCRSSRLRLKAEDAVKECAAMQFMQALHLDRKHVMTMKHDVMCDGNIIYMVMPFMAGGEMFERLQEEVNTKFDEDEARYWMNQIISGVHTLHSAGIAHRDLSLENILLDKSGRQCKVIDFGMAIRATRGKLLSPQGPCGKAFYMSPEVYKNNIEFDPFATDVWSLGVVLFMMIVGSAPFERPDAVNDDCFRWVTGGSRKLRKLLNLWNAPISDEALHLLSSMLCEDPTKRIKLEDVMSHPWMKSHFQSSTSCTCM